MATKKDIFENTLTSAYNPGTFLEFIREMITGVKIIDPERGIKPYNTFSVFVSEYYHIGEYVDSDRNSVGVFAVRLNRGESIERARTAQRTFVKTLLEKGDYSGALVAFYSEGVVDTWRFSFIRMDYEFAKGKIKETLTPAKRYSYLVGKGEPCRTAMDRLLPIFKNDAAMPSLDELEEAFSVETVTKEFFELYKEKYLAMYDFLEQNEDFKQESSIRGFTTEQFTKKLLSQIVFLYFVQKKGWLGVNAIPPVMLEKEYKNAFFKSGAKSRELVGRVYYQNERGSYNLNATELRSLSDEDEEFLATVVKGQPWGTGPKNFMRKMFNDCVKREKNFFDDYLEPLFYTGLNRDRGENAFFPPLHCRIPFLNGGLFEELDNYDWEHNDFQIPNEMFSNLEEKGREADGVLDIFDRYNFTMAEDEPMEREVAVDPEMLGKVFENLLEVRDRKSKGAFYTPREIVHYMCQESIINYLTTRSEIPEEDIRKLVLYGEYFKDQDAEKTLKVANKNGNGYHMEIDKNKDFEIPASIFSYKGNVNRVKELDNLLANVKVVDPAVGSGAFPLGMLNEIVKTRDTLTTYITIDMNSYDKKVLFAQGFVGSRNTYDLKAETIKNCIFACDLEPSATDIAKLRLWLSLVIEDELTADDSQDGGIMGQHSKPKQLPNLDCNIICGNSLIDSFEGVDLIKESDLLNNITGEHQENMLQAGIDNMISTLISLQDKLFYTKDHSEKHEIKEQIQSIYDSIIEEQLKVKPELVEKYRESKQDASKPFVLWQLYFPRVFRDNGGFDVAIGNPPYIRERDNKGVFEPLLKTEFGKKYHQGKMDYWYYFLHKAISVINSTGNISYITPRYWLNSTGATNLIKRIKEELKIRLIVDIGKLHVFDNVVGYHMIAQYVKNGSGELTYKKLENNILDISSEKDTNNVSIKTLYNEDIITDNHEIVFEQEATYSGCITLGQIAEISQGVVEASDKISKKMYSKFPDENMFVGKGIFVLSNDELNALNLSDVESKVIVPYITGKQIHRYVIEQNEENLIYSDKIVRDTIKNDDKYSHLRKHLDNMSKYITSSNAPYGLHRPRKRKFFETKKIIVPSMFGKNDFAIDYNNGYYVGMSFNCIIAKDNEYLLEYILAILNSNVAKKWFYTYGKKRGIGVDIGVEKLRQFPIKPCAMSMQKQIADMVNVITSEYNKELDKKIENKINLIYGENL